MEFSEDFFREDYRTQKNLVSLGVSIISNWKELEEIGELTEKLAYFVKRVLQKGDTYEINRTDI